MIDLRSLTRDADLRSSREAIEALGLHKNGRIAGVEDRLRGIVSLAAIAAAITVAIGVRADGRTNPSETWLTPVSLYAVLQLPAALLAAKRGLGSRSFRVPTPEDLVFRPVRICRRANSACPESLSMRSSALRMLSTERSNT